MLKREIEKLIYNYFNCDVFNEDYQLSAGIKQNIIETFTFAYNHHKTGREINAELEGSNIAKLRNTIRSYNNPFPVRFGMLKIKLQQDAFKQENGTIHGVIKQIVEEYYTKHEHDPLTRLIDLAIIRRHNIKNHNYRKKYGDKARYQARLF